MEINSILYYPNRSKEIIIYQRLIILKKILEILMSYNKSKSIQIFSLLYFFNHLSLFSFLPLNMRICTIFHHTIFSNKLPRTLSSCACRSSDDAILGVQLIDSQYSYSSLKFIFKGHIHSM